METILKMCSEHPFISAFAALGFVGIILALGTWAVTAMYKNGEEEDHVTTRDIKNLINRKTKF